MTQQTKVQQRFTGGELDPALHERYDVQVYDGSIGDSLNVMSTNKGELISRPGTEIVKPLDNTNDKTRIISFIYDENTSFRLEFTNSKLKIYQGSTQITSNVKYYFATEDYDPNNDGSHFIGKDHPINFPFQVGDQFTINKDDSAALTLVYSNDGGATGNVPVTLGSTTLEVGTISENWKDAATTDSPLLTDIAVYESGLSTELQIHATSSTITATELYWEFSQTEWTSPYLEDELDDIQFAQAGDIMFFTHGNHQPMKLERVGDSDFTFSPHFTQNGPWKPEKTYDMDWDYHTASLNVLHQDHRRSGAYHRLIPNKSTNGKRIDPDKLLGRMIRVSPIHSESQWYTGFATAKIVTVNQTNGVLDDIEYKNFVGAPSTAGSTYLPWARYGSNPQTGDDCDQIRLGYLFEEDKGDNTGSWPSCVTIWEDRLIYAGSDTHPTHIAFSKKNDFDDFEPDDRGFVGENPADITYNTGATGADPVLSNPETVATDGFVYVLGDGDASKIQWVKGTPQGLMVGTARAIHASVSSNTQESYSAVNFGLSIASQEGCAPVQPIFTNGRLYYVDSSRTRIMSIGFDFATDNFSPRDESVFSGHLLKDGIRHIAYTRTPIQCLWASVRSGSLVSMVFLPEQDQVGLFKHRIAGPNDYSMDNYIYSMCVLPSDNGDPQFDQLYMAISRPSTYCDSYVERLTPYPMNIDSNIFNPLDMALSPWSEGSPLTPTFFGSTISSPNETQALVFASNHGISVNDKFVTSGFQGGLTYLNGRVATALTPTATVFLFTRGLANGTSYTDHPPYFSGTGWVFTQNSTYTNTDSRWDFPPTVVELGKVLTEGTDYTLTNNQTITFHNDNGYLAFAGYPMECYLTTLPDSRANQQGRSEAYFSLLTDMTIKVLNTRNLYIERLGGSLSVPMLANPDDEVAGESSNRVSGKFTIEVEQIQDDVNSEFKITPETGYPFTLQSIYLRGERASR